MEFSLSLSLGFNVSAHMIPNICITEVKQFGTEYGSSEPATEIEPTHTADGVLIYSFRADTSDGSCEMRFGDSGDEQLTNTETLIYEYGTTSFQMEWDDTAKLYSGVDMSAAEALAAEVGNKVCFTLLAMPVLLIHYDFATIKAEA